MTITLPKPVADYMEASARLDAEAILAPFAADAEVFDENRTHRGREEIKAWILSAAIAAKAVPLPRAVVDAEDSDCRVRAEVAGDFPGTPIMLTFDFGLKGGQIQSLRIAP
ncbi:nuclear transport factor 2 family protein [Tepidicaulis sp. LMO-SS28]|uniref:nuclear transport factor 2 family protein n=1 Tax=Tepidicaulis sp. LMO-SS28 TaxID=3447455 RepID=UPI003EDEF11C